MSRVLFSIWFRIQRIIKKCSGYYSAYGSVFSVLLKNVQGIIQRLVQDSAYYQKLSRVLFTVWLSIRRIIKNAYGIIQLLIQDSGYYSKVSRVLFSIWFNIQVIIQNTTSNVWFRIQRSIKNVPGIIQRLV